MQLFKSIEVDNLEQGSNEWHAFRSRGIGSSEAGIVAGVNKWSNISDLWAIKTGKSTTEFKMNAAIQHGIDTEPEARQRFILATGINVTPKCFINGQYEFIIASLDGISDDNNTVLEIKCPSVVGIHMKAVRGSIPEYYYPQIQHQLFTSGAKLACYWSYTQSMGGFLIEVKPNKEYITELVRREIKLWDCIKRDIQPDENDFTPMSI